MADVGLNATPTVSTFRFTNRCASFVCKGVPFTAGTCFRGCAVLIVPTLYCAYWSTKISILTQFESSITSACSIQVALPIQTRNRTVEYTFAIIVLNKAVIANTDPGLFTKPIVTIVTFRKTYEIIALLCFIGNIALATVFNYSVVRNSFRVLNSCMLVKLQGQSTRIFNG